jgi:hypothetical protein
MEHKQLSRHLKVHFDYLRPVVGLVVLGLVLFETLGLGYCLQALLVSQTLQCIYCFLLRKRQSTLRLCSLKLRTLASLSFN